METIDPREGAGKFYRVKKLMHGGSPEGYGHVVGDIGKGFNSTSGLIRLRVVDRQSTSGCRPYVEYYTDHLEEVSGSLLAYNLVGRYHSDVGKRVYFDNADGNSGNGIIINSSDDYATVQLDAGADHGWDGSGYEDKGCVPGRKYWNVSARRLNFGERPVTPVQKKAAVFEGIYCGDVVVSLSDVEGARAEGQMFTVQDRSYAGNLSYEQHHTSSSRKCWRKATAEEAEAYANGVRNVKDIRTATSPDYKYKVGDWIKSNGRDHGTDITDGKAYQITLIRETQEGWEAQFIDNVGDRRWRVVKYKNGAPSPWVAAEAPPIMIGHPFKIGDYVYTEKSTLTHVTPYKSYKVIGVSGRDGEWNVDIMGDDGKMQTRCVWFKGGAYNNWDRGADPEQAVRSTMGVMGTETGRIVSVSPTEHQKPKRPVWATDGGFGMLFGIYYKFISPNGSSTVECVNLQNNTILRVHGTYADISRGGGYSSWLECTSAQWGYADELWYQLNQKAMKLGYINAMDMMRQPGYNAANPQPAPKMAWGFHDNKMDGRIAGVNRQGDTFYKSVAPGRKRFKVLKHMESMEPMVKSVPGFDYIEIK